MPSPPRITLPGAKLTPGPDDDLIHLKKRLRRKNVSVSAYIKQAVRESIERENEIITRLTRIDERENEIITRLTRIEMMLAAGGQYHLATETEEQNQDFGDPFLDADL